MNAMQQMVDDLAQRVARLERRNRAWKSVCLAGLAAAGLLLLAGWAAPGDATAANNAQDPAPSNPSSPDEFEEPRPPSQPESQERFVISAEKFVLLDSQRRPRAELMVGNLGPVLAMKDEKGTSRMVLVSTEESSWITQLDAQGNARLNLKSDASGAYVWMRDAKGKTRTEWTMQDRGTVLRLFDEQGMARGGFGYFGKGALLRLDDAAGQMRAVLGAVDKGAVLKLTDGEGKALLEVPQPDQP